MISCKCVEQHPEFIFCDPVANVLRVSVPYSYPTSGFVPHDPYTFTATNGPEARGAYGADRRDCPSCLVETGLVHPNDQEDAIVGQLIDKAIATLIEIDIHIHEGDPHRLMSVT
jgi:hypothetical protein